jgi:hypothetical protein
MVGRTALVGRLEALVVGFEHQPARAVLLAGEAGIGKSRVAAELASYAGRPTGLEIPGAAFAVRHR